MALAAVADDDNLLALDQVQVRIAVVVNAHSRISSGLRVLLFGFVKLSGQSGVAPRLIATTPVRETSIRPSGFISSMKAAIFSVLPVISKTKDWMVLSTTRARKMSAMRRLSTRFRSEARRVGQECCSPCRPRWVTNKTK